MLKDKTILLGVTGSIAAYKIASLASMLVKQHAQVHVIMTQNATNFIHPTTFETLTGNKCLIDTFDRNFEFQVEHVSLAKKADIALVAPASANVIGKLAHGIADDMLTTTLLACKAPLLISPAMNTNMYENPIVQDNLRTLEKYGWKVITPATGYLACGDTGAGKMPEPETLYAHIEAEIACEKDLAGKRIVVTAGATQEALDPVRYLTNHSTGKMGYAIAKAAMLRGAQVTLVSGQTALTPPLFVQTVPILSAQDMFDALDDCFAQTDVLIMAAAVADYRPSEFVDHKIKKKEGDHVLELARTTDILGTLGPRKREGQFLCGFSMETENLLENSKAKLEKKHLDMIVANNLRTEGAGFGTDTNVVTLIRSDEMKELPLLSKDEVAHCILDEIAARM
ncbi:MAG: bifunctional phosphopantothenoylcysteine decarboxylase/phosphopantothenate--cysteine ligase CoaBC [Eubacterium sp.]|nr:bifunctional phosphopantothenoylcysteine decarboxylase/phosphopantothenate--cysteine ligase CoaBC [Eubacterium sp.]